MYPKLKVFEKFLDELDRQEIKCRIVGLSATLYSSPQTDESKLDIESEWLVPVNNFINLLGGQSCVYEIDMVDFYKTWNKKTEQYTVNGKIIPVLKRIKHHPIKYYLTDAEYEKYEEDREKAVKGFHSKGNDGEKSLGFIHLSRRIKSLRTAVHYLTQEIFRNMETYTKTFTLIFVQTKELADEMAEELRKHPIVKEGGLGVYVYSSPSDMANVDNKVATPEHRDFFEKDFKKHPGNIMISIRMLSEGYDYPKIDRVILSGSDKSPRDWIQKSGRALRVDRDPNIEEEQIAHIHDLIICLPRKKRGVIMDLESHRYEELQTLQRIGEE